MWCERQRLNELCALLDWLLYHQRDCYQHIINFIILLFFSAFYFVLSSRTLRFVFSGYSYFLFVVVRWLCARNRICALRAYVFRISKFTLSAEQFYFVLLFLFRLSFSHVRYVAIFALFIYDHSDQTVCQVSEVDRNYTTTHTSAAAQHNMQSFIVDYLICRRCWTLEKHSNCSQILSKQRISIELFSARFNLFYLLAFCCAMN